MRDAVPARSPALADESNDQWDVEQWLGTLRQVKGHYTPVQIDPSSFAGNITVKVTGGFNAVDICANGIIRADRTPRDVRLDNYDHYYALFQTAGNSLTVAQNDTVSELSVGNVVLVKSALPVTYASQHSGGRWLSVVLPRSELISHLGFEPRLCPFGRSPRLKRLLFEFALNIFDSDASPDANSTWTKLAFYDLIGALFAVPDQERTTAHSAKLFDRVRALVRDRFSDPDLGAQDIADEAGISLRYLQKLFNTHGTTFGHFLAELRLSSAAMLIRRRALTNSDQPLSHIARTCGYSDYTYFARCYRRRFGHSPRDTQFDSL